MNTADIAEKIAAEHGLTKIKSKEIVEGVLSHILAGVKVGDKVQLQNFGIFRGKETPAKTARNPRTGESVQVPAGKKVAFKPAKAALDAIGAA